MKMIAENVKVTCMKLYPERGCPSDYQRWRLGFAGFPAKLTMGELEIPLENVEFTGTMFNKDFNEDVLKLFFPELYGRSQPKEILEEE